MHVQQWPQPVTWGALELGWPFRTDLSQHKATDYLLYLCKKKRKKEKKVNWTSSELKTFNYDAIKKGKRQPTEWIANHMSDKDLAS